MAGVPGTASEIFETVKTVGANVVMISQVSITLLTSCQFHTKKFYKCYNTFNF